MPQAEQHVDDENDQEKRIDMPLDRDNERQHSSTHRLDETRGFSETDQVTKVEIDKTCTMEVERQGLGHHRSIDATVCPKLVDEQHQEPLAAKDTVDRDSDLPSMFVSDLVYGSQFKVPMDYFIHSD
jgi:hypothetical protein